MHLHCFPLSSSSSSLFVLFYYESSYILILFLKNVIVIDCGWLIDWLMYALMMVGWSDDFFLTFEGISLSFDIMTKCLWPCCCCCFFKNKIYHMFCFRISMFQNDDFSFVCRKQKFNLWFELFFLAFLYVVVFSCDSKNFNRFCCCNKIEILFKIFEMNSAVKKKS